ncbi:MAG TPA: aspartate aminotransferase family protein [Anaerolineae bacterium]|jgi:predicted acetylornithine/succinylornithine family transaminase|nr:aspartate aminotransferase family protein [Anaerolineae bacterium]
MDMETISLYIEEDAEYVAQTAPPPKRRVVEEAHGCTVTMADGTEYLDLIAGVSVNSVGATNPEVAAAVKEQVDKLAHAMVFGVYVVPVQVEVAKLLAQITGPNLQQTFFTNSGTEANEGALKLARKYTGRKKLITMERGFHGRTFGSLSVTWREVYRKPFEPLVPMVEFIPFSDIKAAEKAIDDETAGVIIEPIQSEGGVRVPDDEYMPRLRKLCTDRGALLIFDEVQTGFGRTGKWFCGEHWGVWPDVLALGKAIGGGLPMGAFMSSREIMSTFSQPSKSHITTFGGNAVVCAASKAAIEFMIREKLPDKAAERGQQMMEGLRTLQQRFPFIKDVRGKGLLIGLELDDAGRTERFANQAEEMGVLLGWSMYAEATVRLAPPLIITAEEVDKGLSIIEAALSAVV